jgi:hypothetical protein
LAAIASGTWIICPHQLQDVDELLTSVIIVFDLIKERPKFVIVIVVRCLADAG